VFNVQKLIDTDKCTSNTETGSRYSSIVVISQGVYITIITPNYLYKPVHKDHSNLLTLNMPMRFASVNSWHIIQFINPDLA